MQGCGVGVRLSEKVFRQVETLFNLIVIAFLYFAASSVERNGTGLRAAIDIRVIDRPVTAFPFVVNFELLVVFFEALA